MHFRNVGPRTALGRDLAKAFAPPVMVQVDYRSLELEAIVQQLLKAPDTQLDASMKALIEKWDTPAKAIQILEVLDQSIHSALASTLVIRLLEMLLSQAIEAEETTYKDVVAKASWRGADGK